MDRNARNAIQKEGTAARATWLAAQELLALAELIKGQAEGLALKAQQYNVSWEDAGTAQAKALAGRNMVAQDYYHLADNSERRALELVAEEVAAIQAKW